MSLVVISYNLKSLKISYATGRVSVRIFYKNNLISLLSTRFLQEWIKVYQTYQEKKPSFSNYSSQHPHAAGDEWNEVGDRKRNKK